MKHSPLVEEDSQQELIKKPENINHTREGITSNDFGNGSGSQEEKKKKIIKYTIIGAIVTIVLVLAIVLPIVLTKKKDPPVPPVPPYSGGYNPWFITPNDLQKLDSPYGLRGIIQYKDQAEQSQSLTSRILSLIGADTASLKYDVNSKVIPKGVNNNYPSQLSFSFGQLTWKVGHLMITTGVEGQKRYSIPESAVPNPQDDKSMRLDMIGINVNTNGRFYWNIIDPTDPTNVYVDTKDQTFVFNDKYIQMDMVLPSQRLFGLGERVREFQLVEGTWTMWASGQNNTYDDGTGRRGNYGVHPFVLVQGKNKNDFFGLYFRNSNAQSPVLKYLDNGKALLSYITTGGNIEVFFFVHGSAKDVINSYQNYFGKPQLPPFWSFGWQQASYAYSSQDQVEKVIDSYAKENYPLETMYLDIPYMKKYLDFTVDTDKFKDLLALSKKLHDKNQRLVLIIDGGIGAEDIENNEYYKLGNDDDVFIKSGQYTSKKYNNNILLKVWQEQTVFVDWFNDKCINVWSKGLKDLYDKSNYDGIWIDMNEPTGFQDGEIKPEDAKLITEERKLEQARCNIFSQHLLVLADAYDYGWYKSFEDQSKSSTFNLPFVPRYDQIDPKTGYKEYGNFDNMTISLNATHPSMNGEIEYNLHSLYGHMMAKRTHQHLTSDMHPNKDNRPFILTRSSFTSTGRFSSHWLGDNYRTWEAMRHSISGTMNMNMFGIPQVGPDTCGFFGKERDDELCARWTQLSTFSPLARFHYDINSDPNEPFLMEGQWKDMAKSSMQNRYQYLRHLYTCIWEASAYGNSCYEPLFFYYPEDDKLYQDNIEKTFIVGGALKVTPILEQTKEGQTDFDAYFPKGLWVDLNNPKNIVDTREKGGDTVKLPVDQMNVHTHLKQGKLFAYQDNSDGRVMNTNDLLKRPVSLYAHPDENGYAGGTLFLDKGISRAEILDDKNKQFEYYQIHHQSKSIQFILAEGNRGTQNHIFDQAKIFNSPTLKSVKFACYLDLNLKPTNLETEFDHDSNTLSLKAESSVKFSQIHSIHYGDPKTDLNLCDINSWNYRLKDGLPDYKDQPTAQFVLQHAAGTLPDLQINLRVLASKSMVNVKWTFAKDDKGNYPPAGKRKPVEVPDDFINGQQDTATDAKLGNYIEITEQPFSIKFINHEDPAGAYFTINGMLFDDYLNWINVRVNSQDTNFQGVFGLGERANTDFFFKDGVYGMWARDSLTPNENGRFPGNNMYGTHPIFMYKYKSSNWVGVLYKLANAQDWWIKNNLAEGYVDLQTVSTGGVADIYVMTGTKPDLIVQNYFTLIGKPVLVPQWILGWNQCRWGYVNLDQVKTVVAKYEENDLPLDVQWSDIDYMNKYRSFEHDPIAFADLPNFVNQLHAKNMKWIPILDAGLAKRDGQDYKAYNEGKELDVFMKVNNQILVGEVWPNDAAYPDFFNPNTVTWYQKYLSALYNDVKFDGLWEDMNEASNFCHGICYPNQQVASPIKQKLRYIPTGRDLEYKSMPLDAAHSNGYLQLDTHSYYGTQMTQITHQWFQKENRRTMIIERSSFAGMGKFSSRWLGDNFSYESSMAYSVSGIMLMNIFGITLAGADICGFIDNTTPELCTKWHVVGSFYPFSRNHNNWGQDPQEPYVFKDKIIRKHDIFQVMKDSIKRKYAMIRYYYTNLFLISTQGTGTFYKPVFFEFPDDPKAYNDIIFNVMLGDSLKLSINPESVSMFTKEYYFPAGVWCGISGTLTDDKDITGVCFESPEGGSKVLYPSDLWDYQLHIRQGKIVPLQMDAATKSYRTSVDLQSWPVDLHVLGQADDTGNWYAEGEYVNDDGVTLKYEGNYNHYIFRASTATGLSLKVSMNAKIEKSKTAGCNDVNTNDFLSRVYFYNADVWGQNNKYTVKAVMGSGTKDIGEATYEDATKRLVFKATENICLTDLNELQFTKK